MFNAALEQTGYTGYSSVYLDASRVRGNARRKYREYTDYLDVLTQHQVTHSLLSYMCLVRCTLYHNLTQLQNVQVHWRPWNASELEYYLSPVTRDESDEYRCNIPLIFFHVVEIHLPIKVCRQFGRMTGYHHRFTPPTKNCTGALSINNKAIIQRCVWYN